MDNCIMLWRKKQEQSYLDEAKEEDMEAPPPHIYATYNNFYLLGDSINNMSNLANSLHDTALKFSQNFDQWSQGWGPANYPPPPQWSSKPVCKNLNLRRLLTLLHQEVVFLVYLVIIEVLLQLMRDLKHSCWLRCNTLLFHLPSFVVVVFSLVFVAFLSILSTSYRKIQKDLSFHIFLLVFPCQFYVAQELLREGSASPVLKEHIIRKKFVRSWTWGIYALSALCNFEMPMLY
jgi:hypothetical protein